MPRARLKPIPMCDFCGRPCLAHGAIRFCSLRCQGATTRKKNIDAWLAGTESGLKAGLRLKDWARLYMLTRTGFKCEQCGWDKINPKTGKSPLEINHKDGDCTHNRPENLEVLCPNCHALTPTWKALNKGKGNRYRHAYSRLIGSVAERPKAPDF